MCNQASLRFFLSALAVLAACSPLQAQTFRFQGTPAAVTGTYLLDSAVSFTRTVTIRHRGAASSYFVTFSAGQSGNFTSRAATSGSSPLYYQVYDSLTNRNVLKDLSANPTSLEVLTGSFADSGNSWTTQTASFVVFLLPDQIPPSGTYADTVAVELYDGTPASHGPRRDSTSFSISVTMNSALDISLVPQGFPFNVASASLPLDFGNLTAGNSRAADLVVRSNWLYTVTVTSQNGGTMKNPDPLDTSQVPYTFTVNGTPVALPAGTPQTIVTSAPATPFAGSRYTISVTIGSYGWATEGSYSDLVTIVATAN